MASGNNDSQLTQSEARNPPPPATTPVAPPQVSLPTSGRSRIEKARDFLQDSSRIGFIRYHYPKYRRYVDLERQTIFNSLSQLYTSIFTTQWQHFRRFMDSFQLAGTGAANLMQLAANTYISHWFWDLHVSIRDSVRKISSVAFADRFEHEVVHNSFIYDDYLVALNAQIRPTHVKLTSEDVMYIPCIHERPQWDSNTGNYFNINNFHMSDDIFHGLIDIIVEKKNWNTSSLSEDTLGRATWLLDWFETNRAHAWFPAEGNYTQEDVTISYILGVTCTPKLAPRDVDDWQIFPNGTRPDNINAADYERVVNRRFYGSVEERTVAYDRWDLPTKESFQSSGAKRKKPSETTATSAAASSSGVPDSTALTQTTTVELVTTDRYQIIDWLYYGRVILNIDAHTRTGALRMIVLNA